MQNEIQKGLSPLFCIRSPCVLTVPSPQAEGVLPRQNETPAGRAEEQPGLYPSPPSHPHPFWGGAPGPPQKGRGPPKSVGPPRGGPRAGTGNHHWRRPGDPGVAWQVPAQQVTKRHHSESTAPGVGDPGSRRGPRAGVPAQGRLLQAYPDAVLGDGFDALTPEAFAEVKRVCACKNDDDYVGESRHWGSHDWGGAAR